MLKPLVASDGAASTPATALTLSPVSPSSTGAVAASTDSGQPSVPPILRWEGNPAGKLGATLKLHLKVSAHDAISVLPVQVKYDPTVLQAVDARPGSLASPPGKKGEFTKRIDGAAGMIFVTQSVPGDGIKGDGELVEFEFKTLKSSPNSLVTALPSVAVSITGQPTRQTAAALIGVSVSP